MKLMKRLVSFVCAFGLLASMTSALVVNADEITPTLKLEQLSYDESTKTGRAKITLENIDKTAGTLDNMFVMGYQVAVMLTSDKFDVDLYKTTGRPKPISQNVTIDSRLVSKITGPNFVEATGLAATYADNSTDTALNSYAEGTNDNMSSIAFMEFNFKLADGVDSVVPSFGQVMITTREYDDEMSKVIKETFWGNIGAINAMNYDIATLGKAAPTKYAVTTAATENGTVAVDKETASEGETVTITTTPSEGYEVATVTAGDAEVTGTDNTYTFTMPAKAVEVAVTFKAKTVVDTNAAEKLGNYADGDNDNAVAFKKVFDASSLAGKTHMKLTAMVNGVARVYKGAPVAIPNVDGELKLGVVIQYKDADVNVESLAIELLD